MLGVIATILQILDKWPLVRRVGAYPISGIKKGCSMFSQWVYWLGRRPEVKVIIPPTNIAVEPIATTSRLKYSSMITFKMSPRDKEQETTIDIEKLCVIIIQGRGRTKKSVSLTRDTKRSKKTNIKSRCLSICEEILLEGYGNTEDPLTCINPDKPFRWSTSIQVKIVGLPARAMRFSGKRD